MHLIRPIASPGGVAFVIEASDDENDKLTFALSGTNSGFFNVEPSTGRVFISRELDREVCQQFYFM